MIIRYTQWLIGLV